MEQKTSPPVPVIHAKEAGKEGVSVKEAGKERLYVKEITKKEQLHVNIGRAYPRRWIPFWMATAASELGYNPSIQERIGT